MAKTIQQINDQLDQLMMTTGFPMMLSRIAGMVDVVTLSPDALNESVKATIKNNMNFVLDVATLSRDALNEYTKELEAFRVELFAFLDDQSPATATPTEKQLGSPAYTSCACGWRKEYFTIAEAGVFAEQDYLEHHKVCPQRDEFDNQMKYLKELFSRNKDGQ